MNLKINTPGRLALLLSSLAPFTPAATLNGLWTFDNPANPGAATVGTDLLITGTAPAHAASYADDHASSQSGVVTTVLGPDNRIQATHGIAPNGGGSFVNQYSIVVDLFSPVASRDVWRTIYQTNVSNENDAEYFIRNSDSALGVAGLTYSDNPIDNGSWTRLVITADLSLAGNDVLTYLDGSLHFTHAPDVGLDGRFSLDPEMFFFTDNDGDNAPLAISTIGIFEGVLTPAEVGALGGAGSAIAVPEPGSLAFLALMGCGAFRRRRA